MTGEHRAYWRHQEIHWFESAKAYERLYVDSGGQFYFDNWNYAYDRYLNAINKQYEDS